MYKSVHSKENDNRIFVAYINWYTIISCYTI